MNSADAPAHRLVVAAPMRGWCDTLDDSPDPVFRERTLGDGVSIDPTDGEVVSPFDGEVIAVPASKHAISLRASNGAELLIHFGIDTVALRGQGFRAHVHPGERVRNGQLLITVALDQVLRVVPSLRSPVILLRNNAFEVRELCLPGLIEPGEPLFEIISREVGAVSRGDDERTTQPELQRELVVGLEHGIHARPAAAIIEAIRTFDARIECRVADGRAADVRSAVSMMALGIRYGQTVTVAAQGADSAGALDAIVPLLQPLVRRSGKDRVAPTPADVAATAPLPGSVLRAQPASVGLAVGPAVQIRAQKTLLSAPVLPVQRERERLKASVAAVSDYLRTLRRDPVGAGDEIVAAHLVLLKDRAIAGKADEQIGLGDGAAAAWRKAVGEFAAALAKLDDQRMRERVDDLWDIEQRVQRVLAGERPDSRRELPQNAILVARNLLPSQLLELDRGAVAGICTAAGGTTSHVAILSASLGIPMLVAAGDSVLAIDDGTVLCLDADNAELIIQPAAAAFDEFRKRARDDDARRGTELRAATGPCVLADGTLVHVYANIGSLHEAEDAIRSGADGCGLLRTEFLFMDRTEPPGMAEQLDAYQRISAVLGDRPLVVRLLDAGGDKPLRYISHGNEENPALGLRGIRLGLRNRALLETQLEALCLLHHSSPVNIMIPMVSCVDEVEEVRDIVASRPHSGAAHPGPRLGVMIETPAAALIADELARSVDFFSIGTNDLTQYALAMDRGDPAFAAQLDALHPAVLRLIANAADAARALGKPVAVCGAAAGDLSAATVLLGLGIRELSMPAGLIPRLKSRLRELSLGDCQTLASDALRMRSAREVRAMLRDALRVRKPG